MTPLQLTDLAESVGATVVIAAKPTHAAGEHRYPHVAVTYRGKRQEFHRATLRQCAEDVEQWLREATREA